MYSRLFLLVVKSRLSLKTYGVLHICISPAKLEEASGNMQAALQEKSSYKLFLNNTQKKIVLLGKSREKLEGKAR